MSSKRISQREAQRNRAELNRLRYINKRMQGDYFGDWIVSVALNDSLTTGLQVARRLGYGLSVGLIEPEGKAAYLRIGAWKP